MDLLGRVNARAGRRGRDEQRYSIDTWISDYLIPSAGSFTYGNTSYPLGTGLPGSLAGNRAAEIANSLPGYRAALQACPPAFAAELVRALVLSQVRFTFRNPPWHRATPRRTFGNPDLGLLERPWKNGTTGGLVSRMEWHAGLAGNAFVRREPARLRLLRPDWTAIIHGSQLEPDWPSGALDAELLGYVYANRGIGVGEPQFLLPGDVAHWAPLPDPEMTDLGMSWLTPAIREMQGDRLAAEHKIRFFEQGATPNLVVKGIPAVSREQFLQLVEDMEDRHAGVANAYRTLYLTAGADATVIGSNLAELDLKAVQGSNETRLSVLSRVPAALLGISEGLAGSSLNAGNFSAARRNFADTWVYPSLQDLASSLATVVKVPADAELWFDTADMPILREDAKDAADIEAVKAVTITAYVKEGFTAESAVAAVQGQDVTLLKHSGLLSVQLQPPGSGGPPDTVAPDLAALAAANGTANPASTDALKSGDNPFGWPYRAFNPAEPRDPHGRWTGHGKLPWKADGNVAHYAGHLGIDRADMPQLSGTVNGTYRPSAEMTPKFIARLRGKGVTVTSSRVPAHTLRPTQTTGDMRAIRRMADGLKSGEMADTKPVIVSSDGHVLDGHHNWAGRVLAGAEGGRPGLDQGMPVHRVDMPMKDLLGEAHAFAAQHGLKSRKVGEFASPKHVGKPPVPRDTLEKYTRLDGTWTPERAALHQQIVDGIVAGHKRQEHPQVVFFGGGPASGKSSLTGPEGAARIDPDAIKAQLPEYQAGVANGDPGVAAFTHEESSYIAQQAIRQAQQARIHYLLDGTGDSAYAKLAGKVTQARNAGYEVHAKYVTADTNTAIERAMARAEKTGRMVPAPVIREIHASVSAAFAQAAQEGLFDTSELWDTNGPSPVLIGSGKGRQFTVADPGAWGRFLDKTRQAA